MANYDVNKLTKLGALKALAERIKGDVDTLGGRVGELETVVEGLTTTGGEKNVITEIKVNGTAQTVDGNRAVDITVPTKVGDLENDEGYQKAAEVKSAVDSALNDFAEKVSDDGVVNTYKELVDYAAEHKGEAAAMAGDIAKNKSAIEALSEKVGDTDVSEQIEDALANYVKKDGAKQLSTEDFTTAHKTKLEGIDTSKYVEKDGSKQLSTEDFTSAYKTKLDGIEIAEDAEVTAMLDEVFAAN